MRPAVMGNDTKARGNPTLEAPYLEKDKVKFPRASKSMKLQDKPNALKSVKLLKPEQHHVGFKPPGNSSNSQRPYRDGTGVEELVKYMSNVPAYLQLLSQGDSNQEKALNVGVLDWGHLRKWTDNRRPSITRKETNSLSNCLASSSFSTCESSIQSRRSGGFCSSTDPRKLSPPPRYLASLCAEKDRKCSVQERSSSQFASLEFASMNTSVGQTNLHSTEHFKEKGHIQDKLEKCKARHSTSAPFSDTIGPPHRIPSAGSRSCELSPYPTNTNLSGGSCGLGGRKNLSGGSSKLHDDDYNASQNQVVDDPFYEDELFSFESSYPKDMSIELDHNRFAGTSSEDGCLAFFSPDVSHTWPLPSHTDSSIWSDTNRSISGRSRFALPDEIDAALLNMNGVQTNRFKDIMQKSNNVLAKHPILSTPRTSAKLPSKTSEKSVKVVTRALMSVPRDSSPIRSLIASFGMIKSPSLRGGSVTNQSKGPSFAGNTTADKANADSKARRSPLRRMLDPLLKPKSTTRQLQPSAKSPTNIMRRPSFSNKSQKDVTRTRHNRSNSCNRSVDSCSKDDGRNLTSSSRDSIDPCGTIQHEKHRETSRSQALLRLAWKNGQPLYTFSMNDVDILAATRKSSSECGKVDLECIYIFYCVREMEQKASGWMNQRNRNRDRTLISSVVGKMNVSCVPNFERWGSGTKTCVFSRQFILLGPELRPSSLRVKQSLPDSELAATVIRCYKKMTKSRDPSNKVNLAGDNTEALEDDNPSIVAIMPSEVHGLSDQGAPSSLIDRWKFGGSCDCGGWDAGCSLTILADNIQEQCVSDVAQSYATDDARGAELFIQGGCSHEGNSPSFSLVAFKKGLYTVQFDSSIAVLQAFSVCIAILHSRKSRCFPDERNEVQAAVVESSLKKHQGRIQVDSHTTYVPHHPPLSPVGRA